VDKEEEDDDDDDKPQIYALQFIDHWKALPSTSDEDSTSNNSFLLTSSDDHVHLWEVEKLNKKPKAEDGTVSKQLQFREVMSLWFGALHGPAYGVRITSVTENSILNLSQERQNAQQQHGHHDSTCPNNSNNSATSNRFGGERNPDNLVFVFDAAYCAVNGLLGVALSDGGLRLLNGRGVCLAVLQLPGCQSHLTSFDWDSTGTRLATAVATGHLVTWGIECTTAPSGAPDYYHSLVSEGVYPSCLAVMEGGHTAGRPLYGARYLENDNLLISWGSDGRICLWDGQGHGEIHAPMAVLREDGDFAIFAVSFTKKSETDEDESSNSSTISIAIAGGGTDGGFLGIPVYLQDVCNIPCDINEEAQKLSKKAKTIEGDEK